MTNVFPNSNLPTVSQPWGREVQKRVTNLESQFSLQRTNAATIDAQLQASYRRLDQTVKDLIQADLDIQAALAQSNIAIVDAAAAAEDAQNAIDGLIGLGSTGSSYNINAENITVGTLSGVAVFTSSGNSGVTVYDGKISFDWNSSQTGYIQSFVESGTTIFEMQTNIGSSVVLSNGSVYLGANYGSQGLSITSAGVTVAGNLSVGSSTVSAGTVSAGSVSASSVSASSVNGGDGTFNSALRSSDIPAYPTGGAAVDVYATSSAGRLGTPTSSRRTKQEIEDIEFDVDAILSIRPQVFKYNVDVEEFGLEIAPKVVGFIAEDLIDAGLDYFVQYDQDGLPWTIPYSRYVVALQAVVKNLNDRITILENGATNE
jgi:hypothetical protein